MPDLSAAWAARTGASVASARSVGTRHTYASAWREFITWFHAEG